MWCTVCIYPVSSPLIARARRCVRFYSPWRYTVKYLHFTSSAVQCVLVNVWYIISLDFMTPFNCWNSGNGGRHGRKWTRMGHSTSQRRRGNGIFHGTRFARGRTLDSGKLSEFPAVFVLSSACQVWRNQVWRMNPRATAERDLFWLEFWHDADWLGNMNS